MSVTKQTFGALQKVGKSLMLPVSVLPVAGILLGVGAADFSWMPHIVSQIMENAGGAVFGNMGLLFAIGVALGFSKNDGVSALAAVVGYFIMLNTLEIIAPGTKVGILGGILAGGVAAWAFNRFYNLQLPTYLGFFAGKRSVPIITGFCAIALGAVLAWLWPPVGDAIKSFSMWAAYQNPTLAFGIYGVVERSLIPLGLHHIWNAPFFFEAGQCVNAAGQTLNGVLTCYLSADEATRAAGNGYGQLAGGYLFKMFGLPAAAIAIWHTAKPENRAKIGGIMISAAFTSFLTGITEPIEFAFLFVAPVLYVVHALLAGLAFVITNTFGIVHGTSFSHGFIDYVVLYSNSENGLLIPVFGLAYAVLYYVVFRVLITALNLKTPGREDEVSQPVNTATVAVGGRIGGIITAFGGAQNIVTLDNCITRLRIEVADSSRVDTASLKAFGASGVITMGSAVQAIFGMEAENLRTQMADYISANGNGNQAAAANASKPTTASAVAISALDHDRAAQLIRHFGGKDNIQDILACATSRIRLELKQAIKCDETTLQALGVKHVLPINDKVVHLLMGDDAQPTEAAMKTLLV